MCGYQVSGGQDWRRLGSRGLHHSQEDEGYREVSPLSLCLSVTIIHLRSHLGGSVLIVVLSLSEEDIRQRLEVRHRDQRNIQDLLLVCMI